jgi:6-phosphogluconolactonase (cycloisomerase 2 family)
MSSLRCPGKSLATLGAALVVAVSLGCGSRADNTQPPASPTPTPTGSPAEPWPTPESDLTPAALLLPAMLPASERYVQACVIDPDTGRLEPCRFVHVGRDGDGFGAGHVDVAPGGRIAIVEVYSDTGAEFIQAFHVNASGRVEEVNTARVQLPERTWQLAVHPARRLAYALTAAARVYAFSVGSDGALTPVTSSPFSISARALVFHPEGRFVYALGLPSGSSSASVDDTRSLRVYRVEDTGALTLAKAYSFGPLQADSPGRGDVVIDRTGTYLVTREGRVFRIDRRTGELSAVFDYPSVAVTVAAHPEQDLIFAARDSSSDGDRQLDTLSLNLQSGALSVVSTVEMAPRHHGMHTQLAVEPTSRSLYHLTTHGIYEGAEIRRFSIGSDGSLSPATGAEVYSSYDFPGDFVTFRGPRN